MGNGFICNGKRWVNTHQLEGYFRNKCAGSEFSAVIPFQFRSAPNSEK